MRILGIDQSYTSSGLVVLEDDVVTFFTTVSTKHMMDQDIHARANYIVEQISSIIDQHKPDIIGIEGLAFQQIGNATRDLAGLQFLLINKIRYQMNQQILIHTPLSVKKLATGSGKSKKTEMLNALPLEILDKFKKAKYTKTRGLTDLCDAYFIAKCCQ